jgi:uncharacterized protein
MDKVLKTKCVNNPLRLIKIAAFLSAALFSLNVSAQDNGAAKSYKMKTIPFALKSYNDPQKVEMKGDSAIKITAKGETNLFNNPDGWSNVQNAPMLLFHPDSSNFVFSAKVSGTLKQVYDVAALVVYQDKDLWAKLCYENSAGSEATVVSVITRKYSDDCNSITVSGGFVYLALAKRGNEYSFHCSKDNKNWELIRHFRLDTADDKLMIGFAVHAFMKNSFSAEFSEIKYSRVSTNNMRYLR